MQVTSTLFTHIPSSSNIQFEIILKLFEYLIIENETILSSNFDIMRTVLRLEFENINNVIRKYHVEDPVKRIKLILKKGISHQNSIVVFYYLCQMKSLLIDNQNLLLLISIDGSSDQIILVRDITQTMFEICEKFRSIRKDIQLLCSECIGIIGAIDPSKISFLTTSQGFNNCTNELDIFQLEENQIKFVCSFLQDLLIPSFRSSENTQ